MQTISSAAIDLIIAEECSDQSYYNRKYLHFDWPEGDSGPTVGIGYDCGYVTLDELRSDWTGIVSDETIAALARAIGKKGRAAESWVRENKDTVTIRWDQALRQFREREVPKWLYRVRAALPNTDKLAPDALGAILSLSYNRGCSYDLAASRYVEMREIKSCMAEQRFKDIPEQFRSMARLWTGGVAARREHEAKLFEEGLAEMDAGFAPAPSETADRVDVVGRTVDAQQTSTVPSKITVARQSTSVWYGVLAIFAWISQTFKDAGAYLSNLIDVVFGILPDAVGAGTTATSALSTLGGMIKHELTYAIGAIGIIATVRFMWRHVDFKHATLKKEGTTT